MLRHAVFFVQSLRRGALDSLGGPEELHGLRRCQADRDGNRLSHDMLVPKPTVASQYAAAIGPPREIVKQYLFFPGHEKIV